MTRVTHPKMRWLFRIWRWRENRRERGRFVRLEDRSAKGLAFSYHWQQALNAIEALPPGADEVDAAKAFARGFDGKFRIYPEFEVIDAYVIIRCSNPVTGDHMRKVLELKG